LKKLVIVSNHIMTKNNSLEQNRAPVKTLKQEDVEHFLNNPMKHEILSKRFKTLDRKRKSCLARHIYIYICIHQILTEIRSLLKPGTKNERFAALNKYQI